MTPILRLIFFWIFGASSLLVGSISVFTLSSCVSSSEVVYPPGGPQPEHEQEQEQVASDSAFDYSDFYYHEGVESAVNYHSNFVMGYSYYCGKGDCPICHQHPCVGHKGHSSSWPHQVRDSLAHDEIGHRSRYSVGQNDKSSHPAPTADRSSKNKDDHASGGHETKPVPYFSRPEFKALLHDQEARSGRAAYSSSSSSSGSDGHGSSSKKKSKDDDDKKKKTD